MPQNTDILVVIVNYRTPELTIDALASLEVERKHLPDMHVVVTNAPAGDDSQQRITYAIAQNNWSDWVTFKELEKNGGFAYGNNVGIEPAIQSENPPRYVLMLNPDTVVREGAIVSLRDFLDERPYAGMVGSRLEDPDGTPQASAFRFPGILSELVATLRLGVFTKLMNRYAMTPPVQNHAHETDWVAGASMLVRREVFEQIGYLDEGYFLYYEEVEFCLRAKRAGWQCWYEPASHVVHLVGAASGISDTRKKAPRRPAYWFESRRRYYLGSFGKVKTLLADTCWLVGFSLWRVRRAIQRKPDNDPPKFLSDFFKHSVFCKGFYL
ncbi:MAG: glycosyl transferase family 2 [Phycisphaeraceae bacterium]|nr:glycosyl transferase family 2 [Phycisphaeraceae bacterium]